MSDAADPLRALVVDDDPFQRKVLGAWLQDAGWRVEEAGDADQALARVQGSRVVLVDLQLDGADGFALARGIRDLGLEPPPVLVAMSAAMSGDVREQCRQAGFVHTMAKPFRRENVVGVLRSLAGAGKDARDGDEAAAGGSSGVPAALAEVPALAALWRLEQSSGEPELAPAVEGLRQAGRLLVAAAQLAASQVDAAQATEAVAGAAHGLVGAAGMLGCTRVEATSKALAAQVRKQGVDGQTGILVTVIENEVELAVAGLLRKIEKARR